MKAALQRLRCRPRLDRAVLAVRNGQRLTTALPATVRLLSCPHAVSAAELDRALGGHDPVDVLRGAVLRAMPTVAASEQRAIAASPESSRDLVRRAQSLLAHEFDILGSGPTNLGSELDWRRDFKSGRRWPKVHIRGVPTCYGDGSDVKVPWELSRLQHLPILALAHHVSGNSAYLEELGAQVESWVRGNPAERGVNWLCTMDVAIRATNLLAAIALAAQSAGHTAWLETATRSLLQHGRFILAHLEWTGVRGNHYLANIVGLLCVASLFEGGEGQSWLEWAAVELVRELDHQVNADGTAHEGSIPYHRLVSEMFICGTQVVDALLPGRLGAEHHDRIGSMLAFTAAYGRGDGLAPSVGDADDGRFLPLDGYGCADPRDHSHLFVQARLQRRRPATRTSYPDGGFFIMRQGPLYLLVRCGPVGLADRGSHSHNDQLAFELCCGHQPMVIDPGTFTYTADPVARRAFRCTAAHATLQVDGVEQNDLGCGSDVFALRHHTNARCLTFARTGSAVRFEGQHEGYRRLPAALTHRRLIEIDASGLVVRIRDTISAQASHRLSWSFPLSPCQLSDTGEGLRAQFPHGCLDFISRAVPLRSAKGWYSPAYGRRVPVPYVTATCSGAAGVREYEFVLRAAGTERG